MRRGLHRVAATSSGLILVAGLVIAALALRAPADEWTERPVSELVALTESPDPGTRAHAVVALAKIGGPEAETALGAALDDLVWSVRWRAAEGIGRISGASRIPLLLQQLRTEVETEEKGEAPECAEYYGYVTVPEFLQRQMGLAIAAVLLRDKSEQRAVALRQLTETMASATEKLRMRCQLALVLADLGDRESVPALTEALAQEPSGPARAWSAEALGRLGAQEAVPALTLALEDPYVTPDKQIPLVRQAAARALEMLRAPVPSG